MTRQYRILFLNLDHGVAREENLNAHDDLDALDMAENMSGSQAVEVWDGLRQVARVKRDHAPLNTLDRFCL